MQSNLDHCHPRYRCEIGNVKVRFIASILLLAFLFFGACVHKKEAQRAKPMSVTKAKAVGLTKRYVREHGYDAEFGILGVTEDEDKRLWVVIFESGRVGRNLTVLVDRTSGDIKFVPGQ